MKRVFASYAPYTDKLTKKAKALRTDGRLSSDCHDEWEEEQDKHPKLNAVEVVEGV